MTMSEAQDPVASRLGAITTRWSLVRDAHDADEGAQTAARQAMVMRYEKAIRGYCRALAGNPVDGEDFAQDVIVRLLSGDFAGADAERGRFRDLLKAAIRNMARNAWRKSKTRRAVQFEPDLLDDRASDAQDEVWTASWRDEVIASTLSAVRQHERRNPESLAYRVLTMKAENDRLDSTQLAAKLSEATGRPIRADAFRQKLRRARLLFTDLMLKELARGIPEASPSRLEEELVSLNLLEMARPYLPAELCGQDDDAQCPT